MNSEQFFRDTWQTALVFISLLVLARLLGKAQVGQLTFYEYISGITIGSLAANTTSAEPEKVWSDYYDLLLFCLLTYIAARLTLVNEPMRKLIEGSPTVLIENGQILEHNLKSQRLDIEELMGQLRGKGILDVSAVQFAILETSGSLSVIPKAANAPVAEQDLNIQYPEPKLPIELIIDGEILDANLAKANVTAEWLTNQLASQGVTDMKSVIWAAFDSNGNFVVSTDKKQGN